MDASLHLRIVTAAMGMNAMLLVPATAMASSIAPSEATPWRTVNQIRLAQSGSMGGTIGNREKSLSGSRGGESERPAQHSKPRGQRETPTRRSGGSGGGNFDGAWTVSSVGCSGAGVGTVVVSSGRLIGQGVSGSISPNGTINSVTNVGNGVRSFGSGRASGRRASGIYRQTDGCTGRFTAVKN
ncbi:MAG: hypothetical protein M9932_00890 [Xanthobacteraceae bacterium]|nr:hypothetical protein [Xanthobacteraceae bacterium]